jgi:hypothetical protein
MRFVDHRQENSPDNVGHWRSSLSLGSPARQSFRMTTQRNRRNTFGRKTPHSRQYENRLGVTPRARECPERLEAILVSRQFNAATAARFAKTANYLAMFGGAADRCRVCQKSESKRKRSSVSKGTREARLSRVAAWLNRFAKRGKQLPMRQSGGGASVVVGDVNDDHMAKGRRMIRSGQQKCSLHLEAS